jgi:ribosomal protein L21E
VWEHDNGSRGKCYCVTVRGDREQTEIVTVWEHGNGCRGNCYCVTVRGDREQTEIVTAWEHGNGSRGKCYCVTVRGDREQTEIVTVWEHDNGCRGKCYCVCDCMLRQGTDGDSGNMKTVVEGNVTVCSGIYYCIFACRGPRGSVGIVTSYGLDGPWIETRWRRFFAPVQSGP